MDIELILFGGYIMKKVIKFLFLGIVFVTQSFYFCANAAKKASSKAGDLGRLSRPGISAKNKNLEKKRQEAEAIRQKSKENDRKREKACSDELAAKRAKVDAARKPSTNRGNRAESAEVSHVQRMYKGRNQEQLVRKIVREQDLEAAKYHPVAIMMRDGLTLSTVADDDCISVLSDHPDYEDCSDLEDSSDTESENVSSGTLTSDVSADLLLTDEDAVFHETDLPSWAKNQNGIQPGQSPKRGVDVAINGHLAEEGQVCEAIMEDPGQFVVVSVVSPKTIGIRESKFSKR